MTTAFNSSRILRQTRNNNDGLKPALLSPLTLLLLLAMLFTFFLTASDRADQNAAGEREIIRTEMSKEEKQKASALRYERIVTSADPIRSILQ